MVATGGAAVPAPEGRDLTEWSRLEDQDRDEELQEHSQERRWKGKSKDMDFKGFDAEMGVPQAAMPSLDEEREENGGVNGTYPPVSEEAAEEREVAEVRGFPVVALYFMVLIWSLIGSILRT